MGSSLLRASVAALALATLPAPVLAGGTTQCGTARISAMARACSDVLAASARLRRGGSQSAGERRLATAALRLEEVWEETAHGPGGEACAARSAPAELAFQDLVEATTEFLDRIEPATCRPALARAARRHCRRILLAEGEALRSPTAGDLARVRAVTRASDRLAGIWRKSECANATPPDAVVDGALEVAGRATGMATTRGLRDVAQRSRVRIGTAIEPHEVSSDPAYRPILDAEIDSLTAENAMKWQPVHPEPGVWNFGPADEVVQIARASGMRIRGHALIWGALSVPAYVENASSAQELRAFMKEHIETLAGRYADDIEQWDVVNEPLPSVIDAPTLDGLDDNVFSRLLGESYIAEAFHLAHAAAPKARLYLNENAILLPGPRQERFYELVTDLLAAGVPLHGLGFQGHFGLTPPGGYPTPAQIETTLRRFTALGLEVEITELDISTFFRGAPAGQELLVQARDYRDVVRACLAVPECRGITTWGLNDRYTWIRSFFGFPDDPLPWDDFWQAKPAYFAMRGAFLSHLLLQTRTP